MSEYEARFGAIGRLYGVDGLKRLSEAHVGVIGLGGVGSWAVEALARTGIGKLTYCFNTPQVVFIFDQLFEVLINNKVTK